MIFATPFSRISPLPRRPTRRQSLQGQRLAAPRFEETSMTWETPAYCEIRLGFEVTAYVYVR